MNRPRRPPSFTPGDVTLAEIELAALGIGAAELALDVPADLAAAAHDAGALLVTDPEGAPVAELVGVRATADAGEVSGTARPLGDQTPAGPFAQLRLGPDDLRLDGFVAVVGPDPVDAATLAAAKETGRPIVFVVLDGPRAVPGPDPATVAASALDLRDGLRDDGHRAEVVVVPAPQYGDERDRQLATRIAAAYGAELVGLVDAPDRQTLFQALDAGALPPGEWPPPSVRAWLRWRPPPAARGLVVFFTGLSGSGKSTLSRAVVDQLAESTSRRATLLDGDVVRRHLSAGLGFSPADRDRNIERIGFVAAEIARHGGLAVCAPIAPFAATRAQVRAMVTATGADFLLVHVATPLAECERRDRKGLYARARAGEIADFTGISSPYEAPTDADLVIDTSTISIDQARDHVLALLIAGGWLA